MKYTLSIYNAYCTEIRWTVVDTLEEANAAERCIQYFQGKYSANASRKRIYSSGDIEIKNEAGEIVTDTDIDPDPEDDFNFNVPEGKFLVVHVEVIEGSLNGQEIEIEGTGDLDEDIYGYKDCNLLGYYGYTGIMVNDGKDIIELCDDWFEPIETIEELYFVYDSNMNRIKEGSPYDDDIPPIEDII